MKFAATVLLSKYRIYSLHSGLQLFLWQQGWRSGYSTRLPPMWHGFDSELVAICGLSLLSVLNLLCS